ncbi:MAG: LysM peptidoglycan-binding domain-containing protein [Desulfobacterales bacterium]|nr:LysM peptidoglycan-binding domain-containing protein [Desulfobacterales bacterium]
MRRRFLCGRRMFWALHLAAFVVFISAFSDAAAQPLTHTVKKGDTLYAISQKYFGNPELWPKVWEMNPFVTNPHLLKPGDLIRIGVLEPAAQKPKPKEIVSVAQTIKVAEKKPTGIQVGSLTTLNARGFLSKVEETPWSIVDATEDAKLLHAKGDLLFLDFAARDGIKTGDEFTIFRPFFGVRHVITGEDQGILYSPRAKVILREKTVRNVFRAEIQESYLDTGMGDLVLPFKPMPSCIMPLPSDPGLRGAVVASEQQRTLFGPNSIVYLDSGTDKGLLPGSMLELVRFMNVPHPDESLAYEKMVGRMIVLDAGPETATALVLSTNESLMLGTFFRGSSSWTDPAGSPASFPSCPAQQ